MPTFTLMGLELKNPIIIAAGPWSADAELIQQAIDAGAAGIITETITMEYGIDHQPKIYRYQDDVFNLALYAKLTLEEWVREIRKIDRKGCVLIASIWGSTPSETAYIARKAEQMGFDGLELSVSAPLGIRSEKLLNDPDGISDYIRAITEVVSIPVMVKLSYATTLSTRSIKAMEAAGAKAFSAIDTLRGLKGVDLENFTTRMPTLGGYGGPYLKPISLAAIASLNQLAQVDLAISGGMYSSNDVLEGLAVGASCAQLASVVLINGYPVIREIIDQTEAFFARKGITQSQEICGRALGSLLPYEDLPVDPTIYVTCKNPAELSDDIRKICIYHAIEQDGVDRERCIICGLCVETYPDLFQLTKG